MVERTRGVDVEPLLGRVAELMQPHSTSYAACPAFLALIKTALSMERLQHRVYT
jgi:hypothetical protein